jgi:hypothetical protein
MSGPSGPGIHELAAQTLVDGWHHAGRDGEKLSLLTAHPTRGSDSATPRERSPSFGWPSPKFIRHITVNTLGLMESHQDTRPLPYDGCHDPMVEYWRDGSPWG